MRWNREVNRWSDGGESGCDSGVGSAVAGESARRSRTGRWPVRQCGALLAAVGLVVAGATACGGGSGARERTARRGSGSGRAVAESVRPAGGASAGARLVSDTRPASVPGGGSVATPTEPSIPANVTYEDAESVFRTGEYGRAADLFEAYSLRRPENPWGHYMLGISAWRAGDHERAEAALKETIEANPKHVKGLLNLARVLLEQREASDALEYVERVVELKPESGEGWRVLGNARSDLGMVDDAVEAYRKALVLNHRDAWTMNNLGLLMIREGRYEEALPPLARATELHPDVAVFQNNLGIALERSGHLAESAEAYRTALEANADYGKARISLERVEARAPTETMEALDLAALASSFADDVSRWKEESLAAESEVPPMDVLVPLDTATVQETPDSTAAGDSKPGSTPVIESKEPVKPSEPARKDPVSPTGTGHGG